MSRDHRDTPRCYAFRQHNIEFSCPAASTQPCLELPDRMHPSTRPLRGQLQRFVRRMAKKAMLTIQLHSLGDLIKSIEVPGNPSLRTGVGL